jgi:hypothetical protein
MMSVRFRISFSQALPIVFAFVQLACASVPMASDASDLRAKKFQPVPGAALLYVYRNETFGYSVKMDVVLNDRLAGQTAAKTYLLVTLPPGLYRVESVAEATSTLEVAVEPGRIYFVWQEVKMGALYARSELHLVDDRTGMRGVNQCKLAR